MAQMLLWLVNVVLCGLETRLHQQCFNNLQSGSTAAGHKLFTQLPNWYQCKCTLDPRCRHTTDRGSATLGLTGSTEKVEVESKCPWHTENLIGWVIMQLARPIAALCTAFDLTTGSPGFIHDPGW